MPKIHKHLKKILHPNRWFIWAIVIAVIASAALFFYIVISGLNDQASQQFSNLTPRMVFSDQALGFSVLYPRGWVLERDTDNHKSVVFENLGGIPESITVSKISAADAIKIKTSLKPMGISAEDNYSQNNIIIDYFHVGTNSKNSFDAAIIKTLNNYYYVNGSSLYFQKFLNNFSSL